MNNLITYILGHEFWLRLEYLPVAEWIGASWMFPLLNSLHVVSAALMLGALLMLDLRVAGLAATVYPLENLRRDCLPWIWGGFVVAVLSGAGMFVTRASVHILNVAFQWKVALMALAGLNMWLLQHGLGRLSADAELPMRLRMTGLASLLLWAGVMLAGRWMGHIL